MCLDTSQQPVWRCDARLGEVVPPPRFLLPLYPSLPGIDFPVALKLVVGVESIPWVNHGEEVVVNIRLHRNLDEKNSEVEVTGWWSRMLGKIYSRCKPSPKQSRRVRPCSGYEADEPSCWPWSSPWLWLSGCECQGSAAASSLHLQLKQWEGKNRNISKRRNVTRHSCIIIFTVPTCGDIFSDSSDRYCCTFYPISINILNYSFNSSVDLFR